MSLYKEIRKHYRFPPFSNQEEREEFFIDNDNSKKRQRRDFLLCGIMIFALFGLLDILMGGENTTLLLWCRAIGVASMIFMWSIHITSETRRAREISLIGFAFSSFTTLSLVVIFGVGDVANYYTAAYASMLIFSVTVVVPRFQVMLIVSLLSVVAFVTTALIAQIEYHSLMANSWLFTVALLTTIIGSFAREKLECQAWLKDKRLAIANEEAIKARDEALRANEAKNHLLANVSHELRTPMNAILGFSDMINAEILGKIEPPAYREYLRDIHHSGQILLHNINDLLDFARLEANKFGWEETRFDLPETMKRTMAACLASKPDRKLLFKNEIGDNQSMVIGDAGRLTQAVLNLIHNAMKFSNDDTIVVVSLKSDQHGNARIDVIDSGCGIAPEDLDRSIEAFGQAHEDSYSAKKGGLGLGLAITREIIRRFDGHLEIKSEVDVGTKASLIIPSERLRPALPQLKIA